MLSKSRCITSFLARASPISHAVIWRYLPEGRVRQTTTTATTVKIRLVWTPLPVDDMLDQLAQVACPPRRYQCSNIGICNVNNCTQTHMSPVDKCCINSIQNAHRDQLVRKTSKNELITSKKLVRQSRKAGLRLYRIWTQILCR